MKIAWFTPFSKKSAIGKYSRVVTNEISKVHEIDLWVANDVELLETHLKIINFIVSDDVASRLNKYDLCIYNLGNYLGFHKEIYQISRRFPGIVILHDYVMQHFFAAYYSGNGHKKYVHDMNFYYGEKGRQVANDSLRPKRKPVWETDRVVEFPLFEKVLENAMGVIVHSEFFMEKVKDVFIGPVMSLNFPEPFDVNEIVYSHTLASDESSREKMLVMTLGHINPNKCIEKTLDVLGRNEKLAQKIDYVVVGPHEHKNYFDTLNKQVRHFQLQKSVRFLGYQKDSVVRELMGRADVFINLRFPTTEGASWSLIEQLYFGKPTIVTNVGFYREFPEDCLLKIDPGCEEEQLERMLKKLVEDKEFRKKMGREAAMYVRNNFTAKKYSDGFEQFIRTVQVTKPMLKFVDHVGLEMAVMSISNSPQFVSTISKKIENLWGGDE